MIDVVVLRCMSSRTRLAKSCPPMLHPCKHPAPSACTSIGAHMTAQWDRAGRQTSQKQAIEKPEIVSCSFSSPNRAHRDCQFQLWCRRERERDFPETPCSCLYLGHPLSLQGTRDRQHKHIHFLRQPPLSLRQKIPSR